MFYPPEGLCRAEPEGGPIVFTFDFIGVGNGTGGFKIRIGNPPFWKPADVLFDGTDGLDGPEKCPLNFFIICGYIDYVYIYLYTK